MLYRKNARWPNLWLTLLTAVLALGLGVVVGRASAPAPGLAALLTPGQGHLRRALGALEIVPLEYARAVQGNPQSAAASVQAVRQARQEFGQTAPLPQLYPQAARRAAAALGQLEQSVRAHAPLGDVTRNLTAARAALAGLDAPALGP